MPEEDAHNEGPGLIRNARPGDLPAIVAIYNAAIPGRMATADTEPVTVGAREPWYLEHAPDRHPLFVREHRDQVVGWLSLSPFYGRPAYAATAEVSVYVDPGSHRKGHGTALLKEALQRAPEIGLETLLAFVLGHNRPSLLLFEKLGFSEWGRLPQVARLDGVDRDLSILGRRVA